MWNLGCVQERTAPNMFESSLDLIWGTLKKGDEMTCKPQRVHYPCWTTLINTNGGCKWFVSLEGTDELLCLWHPINLAKGCGRIWISKCELVIMESRGLWSWSVYQVKWHRDFCALCGNYMSATLFKSRNAEKRVKGSSFLDLSWHLVDTGGLCGWSASSHACWARQ